MSTIFNHVNLAALIDGVQKPQNLFVMTSLVSLVSLVSILLATTLPKKSKPTKMLPKNKLQKLESTEQQSSLMLPMGSFPVEAHDKTAETQLHVLVSRSHMLSAKLRKIEQFHAERVLSIESQKREIALSQGRVEKERHLQREAEAQLEFMQGTVLRLIEENKKQGMRRVILEDEKKKMEGELRNLVLHTGSQDQDISLKLASIFAMREQINEQKLKIKEENNNLVRERTRVQHQSASLTNQLNDLKKQHAELLTRTNSKAPESNENTQQDDSDEDSVYYSCDEANSLLASLESDNEEDYFGRQSLHHDWGLDTQSDIEDS